MTTKKSSSNYTTINHKHTHKKNNKMQSLHNTYHIIEIQLLDISLLQNKTKYIPDEYIELLKKCYKINNTIFPYEIIDNKLPKDLYVYLILNYYICKNGKIYQKDYKGRKMNYLTYIQDPYLEDNCNDNRYALDILYFHHVPEEIGKLEIKIYSFIKRTKKWKQNLLGNNLNYNKHIIKSGSVVIINSNHSYEFIIEKKIKNEYPLILVKFNGSIEYPINTDCQ